MLKFAIVCCVVATAFAAPFTAELDDEWQAFKAAHNKQYENDIEPLRRLIWERNVRMVEKHNLEADRGVYTYTMGINEYSDMTSEEFVTTMNGYKMNVSKKICGKFMVPLNVDLGELPTSVDWRDKGYVTDVKNQKQCGSCWSFSATGALEGQHFRKTGKLVSLSEQNLMDCSKKYGNQGCEGGLMDQAFEYIIKNKGVDTEASYPYKARDEKCEFKPEDVGATESACSDIERESESDLQKAVATQGPISVAIDASHESFQHYRSGVYKESRCSQTRLDHGVLAVGYGSENNQDYWIVKNSWGTTWGEEGYIKMARNDDNMCGIATQASFPTV